MQYHCRKSLRRKSVLSSLFSQTNDAISNFLHDLKFSYHDTIACFTSFLTRKCGSVSHSTIVASLQLPVSLTDCDTVSGLQLISRARQTFINCNTRIFFLPPVFFFKGLYKSVKVRVSFNAAFYWS